MSSTAHLAGSLHGRRPGLAVRLPFSMPRFGEFGDACVLTRGLQLTSPGGCGRSWRRCGTDARTRRVAAFGRRACGHVGSCRCGRSRVTCPARSFSKQSVSSAGIGSATRSGKSLRTPKGQQAVVSLTVRRRMVSSVVDRGRSLPAEAVAAEQAFEEELEVPHSLHGVRVAAVNQRKWREDLAGASRWRAGCVLAF